MALLAACVLVLGTASCTAALLRMRGVVGFSLATAVVAAAEVIALSHALSRFDAYERTWFLLGLGFLALVAVGAVVIARPPWPALSLGPARGLAGDPILLALAVIVAVELVYLLALAVLTPPTEGDALDYHLTRALLWIQRGSVERLADVTDARLNDFPVNAELLQGATMLLSDSVRWVGVVQFASLLVAILAAYGIATRIGFARRQAAFGALLLATLPVVALQAPSALNDLVVAALVACAAFFALGRSRAELALGGVAVALLVGTKGTALLALPVLLAVAVLAQRGRRLILALAVGLVGVVVGGAWYAVNLEAGQGLFGFGDAHRGAGGILGFAARATRYAVETVELPGAVGSDRFLYVAAAGLAAGVGVAAYRLSTGVVAAALSLLTLLVLPLERVLHSTYWNGWERVGYPEATGLGTIRDSTVASSILTWYGPVGLAAAVLALVLVPRAVLRGEAPRVAAVLAVAPVVFLLGVAATVTYFDLNGRFVMGGVVLSAATWGIFRRAPAGAIALVVVAATTVLLALVNARERASGITLLEGTGRPSVWTLPREWAQSLKPEAAVLLGYTDDQVPDGEAIAVTRDQDYPVAYAGYAELEHEVVYAETLREATARGVDWAVLRLSTPCASGWRLVFRSPPWGVYRRVSGASCRAPTSVGSG